MHHRSSLIIHSYLQAVPCVCRAPSCFHGNSRHEVTENGEYLASRHRSIVFHFQRTPAAPPVVKGSVDVCLWEQQSQLGWHQSTATATEARGASLEMGGNSSDQEGNDRSSHSQPHSTFERGYCSNVSTQKSPALGISLLLQHPSSLFKSVLTWASAN